MNTVGLEDPGNPGAAPSLDGCSLSMKRGGATFSIQASLGNHTYCSKLVQDHDESFNRCGHTVYTMLTYDAHAIQVQSYSKRKKTPQPDELNKPKTFMHGSPSLEAEERSNADSNAEHQTEVAFEMERDAWETSIVSRRDGSPRSQRYSSRNLQIAGTAQESLHGDRPPHNQGAWEPSIVDRRDGAPRSQGY